jgi:hypothetical protein
MTMQGFPAHLEAPAHVSLFAYDNGAYVVQNFRDQSVSATLVVKGADVRLDEQPGGGAIGATVPPPGATPARGDWSRFPIEIPAHSFRVFRTAG